jgi:hypothetical protein
MAARRGGGERERRREGEKERKKGREGKREGGRIVSECVRDIEGERGWEKEEMKKKREER